MPARLFCCTYEQTMLMTPSRFAFSDMMSSVNASLCACIEYLKMKMKLDPYFVHFYRWAQGNNIPIVILSSGLEPIIRAVLDHLLGHSTKNTLHIVANGVESRDGKDINTIKGWQIQYRDQR